VYHQTIQKQEKIAPEKIVMITTKQPTDKEADVSVHHLTPLQACTVYFILTDL